MLDRPFKLLPQEGAQEWKITWPNDGTVRGKWWEAFHDFQLNELEQKASSLSKFLYSLLCCASDFIEERILQ